MASERVPQLESTCPRRRLSDITQLDRCLIPSDMIGCGLSQLSLSSVYFIALVSFLFLMVMQPYQISMLYKYSTHHRFFLYCKN